MDGAQQRMDKQNKSQRAKGVAVVERRVEFRDWRQHVDSRLDRQDDTLNGINKSLADHMERTDNWRAELKPVIEAFDTMQTGVQTIGKIGDGITWIGKKLAFIAVIFTSIVGALIAWKNWPK